MKKTVLFSFLPLGSHLWSKSLSFTHLFRLGYSVGFAENNQKILKNLKEVSPTIIVGVPRVFQLIYNGIYKNISSKPDWIKKIFLDAIKIDEKQKSGARLKTKEVIKQTIADKIIFNKSSSKLRW